MTCSRRESLGEGDGKGEGRLVEASGANGIEDVNGVNMDLGGCTDGRDHWLACLPSHLLPIPRPIIGYILKILTDKGGLLDGFDDIDDSWTECMRYSSLITCKILVAIQWMFPKALEVALTDWLAILAIAVI